MGRAKSYQPQALYLAILYVLKFVKTILKCMTLLYLAQKIQIFNALRCPLCTEVIVHISFLNMYYIYIKHTENFWYAYEIILHSL